MTSFAKVSLTCRGEAGRSGKDARSDLHVVLEPRGSGGLEVEMTSRVAVYYGNAIRTQTCQVLRELGIEHARVQIEDHGAFPFVIAARIEAAALRAGVERTRKVLPEHVDLPAPSSKDRIRCTRLYLPGSEPKYFVNASLYEPDAIILDLEDSVHPAEKDAARIVVRNALRAIDFGRCERMVRINQLPLGLEDLKEVVPEFPDLILLPKTEDVQQVVEADRRITEILSHSAQERPIWIMPILESALGLENAFAIARASDRVCALTIGLEDYTSDLGVVKTSAGQESLYARMRLVNAAKAAGVQAIDSVYGNVGDLEGLVLWAAQSRAMGFEGMGCVHPSQIAVVRQAFKPSQAELSKAINIVRAYEEAQARGLGVVSLGSKMIDPPVVARALKLAQRAQMMGMVTDVPVRNEEAKR
ncbi:MAG: aldolase/citrate lyase family protein [Acidobacteriaceae bacterium]